MLRENILVSKVFCTVLSPSSKSNDVRTLRLSTNEKREKNTEKKKKKKYYELLWSNVTSLIKQQLLQIEFGKKLIIDR